jgi:hypothetical protein
LARTLIIQEGKSIALVFALDLNKKKRN